MTSNRESAEPAQMKGDANASVPLARFAAHIDARAIPPKVMHEAKRALVNYFAVALAGSHDPTIDIAMRVYGRFRSESTSRVIGRDDADRMDALNAAALNAASANVFDYDDTHLPTIIHPTAPIAAALFALAETRAAEGTPVDGATWLAAFVAGVEVACRIGNAVSPQHYARGWHITSTCCVFGAAAGAAHVLGLDATRTHWALGHASAQAGGLVETLGTMSKSISVGNAARNGLLSAYLAAEGFSGPDAPLDGVRGFLRVVCDAPRFDALTTKLGAPDSDWALLANMYKPYPCGVVLNPVIDACLDVRANATFTLDEIEHVELTGHPLLRQRTDRPGVTSGRASQVSAQHAVAAVLARGQATLDEFSDAAVAEPALRAFASRVRFIDDDARSVDSARVTVHLRNGERVTRDIAAARGSLAQPLTDDELDAKLQTLAAWGGSHVDPAPLAARVWRLDSESDAAAPMRAACPHRPSTSHDGVSR